MMILDEAVTHHRKQADKNRRDVLWIEKHINEESAILAGRKMFRCKQKAGEHEQYAQWLGELQGYRGLKDRIAYLKKDMGDTNTGNSDYLTGYLCALSVVEGMISEIQTKECKNGQMSTLWV